MRPHPKRTSTNPRFPRAWGTCDRSGFITNHEKLSWQFDWRGTRLENLRVLVAPDMLDKPQRQLGTIILPPDPVGILNARPEAYVMEEGSIFYLIQHAKATGSGTSVSVSLPSRPQQGNMVAVGVVFSGVPAITVSDKHNSYTQTPSGVNGASFTDISVFYLPDVPANADATITVKAASSMTATLFAAEFAGPSIAPFDTEIFATGSGSTITTPTITTSNPDILFAVSSFNSGIIFGENAPWLGLDSSVASGDAYLFQSSAGTRAANFFTTHGASFINGDVFLGNPLTTIFDFGFSSVHQVWATQIVAFKSWLPLSP